jgi:hypothetical protein
MSTPRPCAQCSVTNRNLIIKIMKPERTACGGSEKGGHWGLNKGKVPAPPTSLIRHVHLAQHTPIARPGCGHDRDMGPKRKLRPLYNNITSQTGWCRQNIRQPPCPQAVWLWSCLLHSLAFVLFARFCLLCPSPSVLVSEGRNGAWRGACILGSGAGQAGSRW